MRRVFGVAAFAVATGGIVLAPSGDSEPLPQAVVVPEVQQAAKPDFLKRIRFAPARRAEIEGPSDEDAIRIAMERGAELRKQRDAGPFVPTAVETVPDTPGSVPTAFRPGWEVTGTRVNLRAGPGTNHPVVGRADLGERMEPVGDTGANWIRVRRADGQEAWIFAKFLSPANG